MPRQELLTLPMALGTGSASAAGTPTFASWPQARFDLANSGFNPYETSQTFTVTILDDTDVEDTEVVGLMLSKGP